MLLEATSMGLGTLWMGVHPKEDRIACMKAACKLPEGIEPLGLVSIGEQTKEYAPIDRYMEERIYLDAYGTKWDK